jgi:glutamine synthetase adenylyltransferase
MGVAGKLGSQKMNVEGDVKLIFLISQYFLEKISEKK